MTNHPAAGLEFEAGIEKTYTADQVKKMLGDSMTAFQAGMIGLIRECAAHPRYKNMTGEDALKAVADKLEALR